MRYQIISCVCCGETTTVLVGEIARHPTNCWNCFSSVNVQEVALSPEIAKLINRVGTPDPPRLYRPSDNAPETAEEQSVIVEEGWQ